MLCFFIMFLIGEMLFVMVFVVIIEEMILRYYKDLMLILFQIYSYKYIILFIRYGYSEFKQYMKIRDINFENLNENIFFGIFELFFENFIVWDLDLLENMYIFF